MTSSNYHFNPSFEFIENLTKASPLPVLIMLSTDICPFCAEIEPWMAKLAVQGQDKVEFILIDLMKYKENASITKKLPNGSIPMLYLYQNGILVEHKSVSSLSKLKAFFLCAGLEQQGFKFS